MVKNVTESRDFLKSLAKASRQRRKSLLKLATPTQLKALQEISFNVAKNTVPLKKCQIKKIIRGGYKKALIACAKRKGSLEAKRKIFMQRGGFLQYIIPAALMYLQKHL